MLFAGYHKTFPHWYGVLLVHQSVVVCCAQHSAAQPLQADPVWLWLQVQDRGQSVPLASWTSMALRASRRTASSSCASIWPTSACSSSSTSMSSRASRCSRVVSLQDQISFAHIAADSCSCKFGCKWAEEGPAHGNTPHTLLSYPPRLDLFCLHFNHIAWRHLRKRGTLLWGHTSHTKDHVQEHQWPCLLAATGQKRRAQEPHHQCE